MRGQLDFPHGYSKPLAITFLSHTPDKLYENVWAYPVYFGLAAGYGSLYS